MRKKWICGSKIAVSAAIVVGLGVSCAMSSCMPTPATTIEPTPTPPDYPADISGRVIIAEKMKCNTAIAVPPNRQSDFFG